jgi:fumarylpyruvate hydrolase
VSEVGHPEHGALLLTVNGEVRQEADLNQMIWKVPEMISYLSTYFELTAGDVIMSGTPSGVAAVEKGDVMVLTIDGLDRLEVKVT